jgi:glycosyltransferase involved in cell wall biosynthesis
MAIEAACSADPAIAAMHWIFPEVAVWPLRQDREPVLERSYNLLWQIAALRAARGLCRNLRFDMVHHLTWGGLRAPSFLWALRLPFVMGPLGGGETSPRPLRRGLRARAKLAEFIRDVSNATLLFNPLVSTALRDSWMIAARTNETRLALPRAMRAKTIIFPELVLRDDQIAARPAGQAAGCRLLFVGRLLYWKGLDLVVAAFSDIAARNSAARLTILGTGPEEARLRARIRALHLTDRVSFMAWLPRDQLGAVYHGHDLLLFPSLHDSGGNVVLESLGHGLPALCLDIGGPAQVVTQDCGIVIRAAGRSKAEVTACIVVAVLALLNDPARHAAMSRAALVRARTFIVSRRVSAFYSRTAAMLDARGTGAAPPDPVQLEIALPGLDGQAA